MCKAHLGLSAASATAFPVKNEKFSGLSPPPLAEPPGTACLLFFGIAVIQTYKKSPNKAGIKEALLGLAHIRRPTRFHTALL